MILIITIIIIKSLKQMEIHKLLRGVSKEMMVPRALMSESNGLKIMSEVLARGLMVSRCQNSQIET